MQNSSFIRRTGRGNSQILGQFIAKKHERLEEEEFQSTKMKLYLLKKFERTMIAERENQNKRILAEIANQNQLLEQIRSSLIRKRVVDPPALAEELENLTDALCHSESGQFEVKKLHSRASELTRRDSVISSNSEGLQQISEQSNDEDDKFFNTTGGFGEKSKNKKNFSFSKFLINKQTQNLKNTVKELQLAIQQKENYIQKEQAKTKELKSQEEYLIFKEKQLVQKELSFLKSKQKVMQAQRQNESIYKSTIEKLQQKQRLLHQLIEKYQQGGEVEPQQLPIISEDLNPLYTPID